MQGQDTDPPIVKLRREGERERERVRVSDGCLGCLPPIIYLDFSFYN